MELSEIWMSEKLAAFYQSLKRISLRNKFFQRFKQWNNHTKVNLKNRSDILYATDRTFEENLHLFFIKRSCGWNRSTCNQVQMSQLRKCKIDIIYQIYTKISIYFFKLFKNKFYFIVVSFFTMENSNISGNNRIVRCLVQDNSI